MKNQKIDEVIICPLLVFHNLQFSFDLEVNPMGKGSEFDLRTRLNKKVW